MRFLTRLERLQELRIEFDGATVTVGARTLKGGDVELIVVAPREVRLTPPAVASYGKPATKEGA